MIPGKCNSQEKLSHRMQEQKSAASVIAREALNYRQDHRSSFKFKYVKNIVVGLCLNLWKYATVKKRYI